MVCWIGRATGCLGLQEVPWPPYITLRTNDTAWDVKHKARCDSGGTLRDKSETVVA